MPPPALRATSPAEGGGGRGRGVAETAGEPGPVGAFCSTEPSCSEIMRDTEKALREFARHNRSHMNDAEVRLWIELRRRALGHRFHRQRVIGRFIVDFVCVERRLVVEVDGSQHEDSSHDRCRDEYLASRGYRVLRFWSWDVLAATGSVVADIREALLE